MKALIAEFDRDDETITIMTVDIGRDLTPPSLTRRVTHIDSPGVLLGHRSDDPFEHGLSRGNAIDLRDFLVVMYPFVRPSRTSTT